MRIFVFAENENFLNKLCQSMHALSDQVEAIVIGNIDSINGAANIWQLPEQENRRLEDYTDSILAFIKKEQPDWVVFEPIKRCKFIAGVIAASLNTTVLTDILSIKEQVAQRMVFGGLALQKEKVVGPITIAVIGSGVFEEKSFPAGTQTASIDFVEPRHSLKLLKTEQKPSSNVNIANAKRIIGIGRGIGKEENIKYIQQLADKIDAELGCSRPIAESEGWMPKEVYIGVSGLMLSPDVYLAAGISGQVQHMVGINRSKTIIAINKDKNAPIFKQADYGIIGDLKKIIPVMINSLSK